MRVAAAAAIIFLASCAAAVPQPASEASDQACAESETGPDSMCSWRAINANRTPGAFEGYYRAATPGLDAELAIVEDEDEVFVAANYWIDGQGCTARFAGRRDREALVIAPATELAIPGGACRPSLQHGASRDEVVFSMQQSCSSACRAPISGEGVQFRIADPHD